MSKTWVVLTIIGTITGFMVFTATEVLAAEDQNAALLKAIGAWGWILGSLSLLGLLGWGAWRSL